MEEDGDSDGGFELSGAPLENIHQTCDEVYTHLRQFLLGKVKRHYMNI